MLVYHLGKGTCAPCELRKTVSLAKGLGQADHMRSCLRSVQYVCNYSGQRCGELILCFSRDSANQEGWSALRQNGEKTDWWVVAAMATPDMTHPRGLWAGHAPRSAKALSFVSLSEYASAVGVEGRGRGMAGGARQLTGEYDRKRKAWGVVGPDAVMALLRGGGQMDLGQRDILPK